MECCSPDVGDCPKCHPELWIQKGGSYCSWIPKDQGHGLNVSSRKKQRTRINRKAHRLSHHQALQKKTRRRTG